MPKNDTRKRVVRAFFRREYDHAGAFHTAGGVLYSYDWPIARLDESGKAVATEYTDRKYSVTTSGHQAYARLAISTPGYF
jgi:hypothetical protein